jgi:hypothetical protein
MTAAPTTGPAAAEVVIVGGGPTASSLLERLVANVPELLAGRSLRVHLVDPFPVGVGRVWRPDNDVRLWMNSLAQDVTLFTDDSVRCEGPIRPGPALAEWAGIPGTTFPTRRVQSGYLEWFHRQVLAGLPDGVEVVAHVATAVDLRDGDDGRQVVRLDDGRCLVADAVVLALGHLDAEPDEATAALGRFADRHGLVHLPPGHTAELDLSVLAARADVLVLGMGQAFTDLLVLVTEGRGGRFEDTGGRLRYVPSGDEPVLHVGSRRGVPYRSKVAVPLQAGPAPLPRFLDDAGIGALTAGDRPLSFRRDVLPTVVKEVGWAWYHELFLAHPARVRRRWDAFAADYAAAAPGPALDAVVADAVPDPQDRYDPLPTDRPLAGLRFPDAAAAHRWIHRHVAADVDARTDPARSPEAGAFVGLLSAFASVARIAASGGLSARARVEEVNGWWYSFFMYDASGPPPERLRQLLAVAEAGLVRFVGARTSVTADEAAGTFVARSASHGDAVRAGALVDARIAPPALARTRDRLLQSLRARGEACEEVATDASGWSRATGKVLVAGPDLRLVAADGRVRPRHAVGVFTSRPAAGAFARPRTNALAFRQHDAVARSVLRTVSGVVGARRP